MSDIFSRFGVEYVMGVVQSEVEWTFGDWPEGEGIGSSDVSAVVRNVVRNLDSQIPYLEQISDSEMQVIRQAVMGAMREVLH